MSGDRFTPELLLKKGLVPDGNGGYRPKTKDEILAERNQVVKRPKNVHSYLLTPDECMPVIKLKLFGVPMPKQSFHGYADGTRNEKTGSLIVKGFSVKKHTARTRDYQDQIVKQLPAGFKMFSTRVHIHKMHFIYPPLKKFNKATMERIERGEIIFKETKPDISDNLKKLPMDAMTGIVYKDDSIIVSEDNIKKYYGTGGLILIELTGY